MTSRAKKKRDRMGLTFQVGHYYQHEAGRYISILGTVKSYRWGECLVIEEADETGHAMSVIDRQTTPDNAPGWTEVGEAEWRRNFEYAACDGCNRFFEEGDDFVQADEGVYHRKCYEAMIAPRDKIDEVGRTIIEA